MQKFGIDISRWQSEGKDFDFAKAKAEGVEYVIIKCGGADGGLYQDRDFEKHYKKAKEQGFNVGAYFFGYANTVAGAKAEADKCISIIKGKKFEYPIFYDVESDHMYTGSKTNTTAIVTAFCERLEESGYWAGFYTNENWYYDRLDGAGLSKRFSFWYAKWCATKPTLPNIQMWQYGGEYNVIRSNIVAGVVCDQDYCYVDFPTMIKNAERNGYEKMTEMEQAKKWAVDNGLILGYANGDYGWKNPMTREQFITVLFRYYNKSKNKEIK